MAIQFCPKCGSMMVPNKDEENIGWKCRKCGHAQAMGDKRELVLKKKTTTKVVIPVFDLDKTKDKLSTIEIECHKCGGNQALWWIQQTRSGDEPATRFYKCIECGHTWREYA